MKLEIRSNYDINDIRKNEIIEKEWCSDIYALWDGKEYYFEFISINRFLQESYEFIEKNDYFCVNKDTIIMKNVSYENIVKYICSKFKQDNY